MVNITGAAVLAERPTGLLSAAWLATLPNRRIERPVCTPTEGVLPGLSGAVTDLAVSGDGRVLVAAHRDRNVVSIIDTGSLSLSGTVDVEEPSAPAVADRCYVNSAAVDEDTVVAIDITTGVELAAKEIAATARGLAVSNSGDTLYVPRCTETGADIAVIDTESGHSASIPLADTPDAVVGAVRASADGTRLYVVRTTVEGSALLVIDARAHRVLQAVDLPGSVGDIAVLRDGRRVFATGWDDELGGVLSVIDVAGSRVVDTIAMGGLATQVVLGGTRAYVVGDERVVVVDIATMRVVATIEADRVSCIALDPDEAVLYIGGYDATVTARQVDSARLRAAS